MSSSQHFALYQNPRAATRKIGADRTEIVEVLGIYIDDDVVYYLVTGGEGREEGEGPRFVRADPWILYVGQG